MDPYAAQTYPPQPSAQIQPPNQDPYLYNQYPYYPPQIPQQEYPNPNPVYAQQPEQEAAPIHPPGVPIPNDPNQVATFHHGFVQPQPQPHLQNDPYYQQQSQQQQLSYPDAGVVNQAQHQWQPQGQTAEYGLTALYPPNGQGGRGRGRGGFRGGRGRGRGRFGKISTDPNPRAMAWCELCRVDCNTLEILESHKNGKKHKKNLKIQEDLQKLAARAQESQIPTAPEPESEEEQRNGLKRKMVESEQQQKQQREKLAKKQQKESVPFICELCNVKCESGPTFESHLKGKKHGFNLQRFQEQQASLGQAALQALYPALEALYPALLQALSQNANIDPSSSIPLDQQVLHWLQGYLAQTGPAVLQQGTGPVLGPGPVPGPGPSFGSQGLTLEGPVEVAQEGAKEVEPVKETESKIEEKVGPESGVELKVAELEPKPEQEQHEPEAEAKQEQKQEKEAKE